MQSTIPNTCLSRGCASTPLHHGLQAGPGEALPRGTLLSRSWGGDPQESRDPGGAIPSEAPRCTDCIGEGFTY